MTKKASASKANSKASAAGKPRKAKATRSASSRGKAAFGVEPITEGPYANSGPAYEERVAKGNVRPPEGTRPVITSPGSVTV